MKKSYIVVELVGGFGNQIFLLEIAKYLSSLNSGKIVANLSHIETNQFEGRSTIEDLNLEGQVKLFRYNIFLKIISDYTKKYLRYINKIKQNLILVLDENDFLLKNMSFETIIFERQPKFIFIFGYWQSFSFWQSEEQYAVKNPCQKYLETCNLMELQKPIIFHYRIGAYGTKWEYQWGILSPNFLKNSLRGLNLDQSDRIVWIFSDNLIIAQKFFKKANIPENFKLVFFDDSGLSAAEIFLILSKSKYLICGNSTFSLAAAKVGNVEKVIVPSELSKYARIHLSPPDNWLKIESLWL